VAQQIALDHPLSVASLVLADTLAGAPPGSEGLLAEALHFIENNDMAEIARARITNAFTERVDPVLRDYLIDQVSHNRKEAYVQAARAAFGFNARERLGEIGAPTLVVVGEQDRVTPPVCSEELARGIRGARLAQIPRGGHITNVELPAEFNRVTREFLLPL